MKGDLKNSLLRGRRKTQKETYGSVTAGQIESTHSNQSVFYRTAQTPWDGLLWEGDTSGLAYTEEIKRKAHNRAMN